LNDEIKGYGSISDVINPTDKKGHPFFTMPLLRIKRSHGIKHRTKKKKELISTDEYEKQILDRELDFKSIYHK
jgi:hypothetical protein